MNTKKVHLVDLRVRRRRGLKTACALRRQLRASARTDVADVDEIH